MTDMRDWPTPLRINVEALRLAPMIYYCKARVYGDSGKLWEGLTKQDQERFVVIASTLLEDIAPAAVGSRATLRMVKR